MNAILPSRGQSIRVGIHDMEKETFAFNHAESDPQHHDIRTEGLSNDERQWLNDIDQKEANRIYHKVDKRLVPMLALLYLISNLDRVSSLRLLRHIG